MKINKTDKNIRAKFEQREIVPSVFAWERLSAQLDAQQSSKTGNWLYYARYTATILVLISIGMYLFSNDLRRAVPMDKVLVHQAFDTVQILRTIGNGFNKPPIEKVSVKTIISKKVHLEAIIQDKGLANQLTAIKEKQKNRNKKTALRSVITENKANQNIANVQENKVVVSLITAETMDKTPMRQNTNNSIKVNLEDLLYAVSNEPMGKSASVKKKSEREVNFLVILQKELKKTSLKVDPQIILAEVEQTINDDFFDNNFLKALKNRITNIAAAVASRNN
ncbi:hypothetical protein PI23P_11587 [Polaribacter irgensii 23-P]|uniref:Uncharacterized protein n=1 Tax=Polaribacter irgensii 23-P TaxID=313594 RepID=A4C1H0_9FLAO|nr:hypothetical protein [Polaribacter irgensii]EAR11973.1 hypothetical protein PI23P_11587 [Polaribacter irgensii 23-P]